MKVRRGDLIYFPNVPIDGDNFEVVSRTDGIRVYYVSGAYDNLKVLGDGSYAIVIASKLMRLLFAPQKHTDEERARA